MIKLTGKGVLKEVTKDGKVVQEIRFTNTITSSGKNIVIKGLLGSIPSPQITHIAVGKGTTAPTVNDTQLESQVAIGEVSSSTEASSTEGKFIGIFADSEVAADTYTELGIFVGSTLFGRAVPSQPLVKTSGNDIFLEYSIEIS